MIIQYAIQCCLQIKQGSIKRISAVSMFFEGSELHWSHRGYIWVSHHPGRLSPHWGHTWSRSRSRWSASSRWRACGHGRHRLLAGWWHWWHLDRGERERRTHEVMFSMFLGNRELVGTGVFLVYREQRSAGGWLKFVWGWCLIMEKQRTGGSWLTLRAHQHHGHLSRVPVAGQAQKVVIDRLETDLVLQAEDEHHGVHPGGKLSTRVSKRKILSGNLVKIVYTFNQSCLLHCSRRYILMNPWLACEGAFPEAMTTMLAFWKYS